MSERAAPSRAAAVALAALLAVLLAWGAALPAGTVEQRRDAAADAVVDAVADGRHTSEEVASAAQVPAGDVAVVHDDDEVLVAVDHRGHDDVVGCLRVAVRDDTHAVEWTHHAPRLGQCAPAAQFAGAGALRDHRLDWVQRQLRTRASTLDPRAADVVDQLAARLEGMPGEVRVAPLDGRRGAVASVWRAGGCRAVVVAPGRLRVGEVPADACTPDRAQEWVSPGR